MFLEDNKNKLLQDYIDYNKDFFNTISKIVTKNDPNTLKKITKYVESIVQDERFTIEYYNKAKRNEGHVDYNEIRILLIKVKKKVILRDEHYITFFLDKDKITGLLVSNNKFEMGNFFLEFKYKPDFYLDIVASINCEIFLIDKKIRIRNDSTSEKQKYLDNTCSELTEIANYDYNEFINYLNGSKSSLEKMLEINLLHQLQFDNNDTKNEYYLKHEGYFFNSMNTQDLKLFKDSEQPKIKDKVKNIIKKYFIK